MNKVELYKCFLKEKHKNARLIEVSPYLAYKKGLLSFSMYCDMIKYEHLPNPCLVFISRSK